MSDVASIVIAVISLVGTLLAASIAAWFAFFTEERKRRTESQKLISKYYDPLLLASQDLQSRLYNLMDQGGGILGWLDRYPARKDNLVQYTCFLVGQYLSWVYILRRQGQFIRLSSNKDSRDLTKTLDLIEYAFSTTHHGGELGRPFILWRGQQLAIAEAMTVREDGELFCMGYGTFHLKWLRDDIFRQWFGTLVEGLTVMAAANSPGSKIPNHRLRHLQHLLLQLVHILDPEKHLRDQSRMEPVIDAPRCLCSKESCTKRRTQQGGLLCV